ncbi:hypothetical protein KW782_01900 [Candidatus Parcubacteria bacterium]|nr:hypothetical protein [Candidatus Parcubacteria bacterium]
MKKVLYYIVCGLGLYLPMAVFAQLPDTTLSLRFSPQYPQPGQSVSFTVLSGAIDLNRSDITWLVNGSEVSSGKGKTSFKTTAAREGSQTSIRVVAVTADGKDYEVSQVINPGTVDLIWEAKSYTPPFYRGKALYPFQGEATVVAMSNFYENGTRLSPKNLIYAWKVNGQNVREASGFGKDSMTVTSGVVLRAIEVIVTVSSQSGKTLGTGRVVLTPQSPEIVLYEEAPLYGPLYHRALGQTINLLNEEIWLKAAPYFFSTAVPHDLSTLTFDWRVNNTAASEQDSSIILRHTGTETGRSLIGAKATNPAKLLQYSNRQVTITFNAEE